MAPSLKESPQTSQTLTGLVKSNLTIGIWFEVHLLHSNRPQCRLGEEKEEEENTVILSIVVE